MIAAAPSTALAAGMSTPGSLPIAPAARCRIGNRASPLQWQAVAGRQHNLGAPLPTVDALRDALLGAHNPAAGTDGAVAAASAWPLPGAEAGQRSRPKPAVPRATPPKRPGPARGQPSRRMHGIRISGGGVRRGRQRTSEPQQHGRSSGIARINLDRPNIGLKDPSTADDVLFNPRINKEQLISTGATEMMKHAVAGPNERHQDFNDLPTGDKGRAGREQGAGYPEADDPPPPSNGEAPALGSAVGPSPSPARTADLMPSCLHATDINIALRQVRKSAAKAEALRFCVHFQGVTTFEHVLSRCPHVVADNPEPVLAHVLRESMPLALQQANIHKFRGLGQRQEDQPHAARPVGDDMIVAVKTVSRLPHALRKLADHQAAHPQLLADNSFAVLEHHDLSGQVRLLVAWSIQAPAGNGRGSLHAGMLDIEHDATGYRIVEPSAGLVIFHETLAGLVAGLEDLSGCRFAADSATIDASTADDDVPRLKSSHVYVGTAAPAAGPDPDGAAPLQRDDGRAFLALYPYRLVRGRRVASGVLLRASFSVIEDRVAFIDASGRLGEIELREARRDKGQYTLRGLDGTARAMLKAHGLGGKQRYPRTDIAQLLRECGLAEIPASPYTPPADDDDAVLPSTLYFEGNTLHYIDPDGHTGTVAFHAAGYAPDMIMLAEDNPLQATVFAQRHGIRHGARYRRDELAQLLMQKGYLKYRPTGGPC